jgi:hypothetical protein
MPVDIMNVAQIMDRSIKVAGGGVWTNITGSGERHWTDTLAAQVGTLVGEQPIIYSSGYVNEENNGDIDGRFVAFTSKSVIQAKFEVVRSRAIGGLDLTSTVFAVPRTKIIAVEAKTVHLRIDVPTTVKGSAVLLTLEDESTIALPLTKNGKSVGDDALLAFIPNILEQADTASMSEASATL